jgi:hypothetical protein
VSAFLDCLSDDFEIVYALGSHGDRVMPGSHRRKRIRARSTCLRLYGDTLIGVQQRHLSVGDNRSAAVGHRSGDGAFINLRESCSAGEQEAAAGDDGEG